MAEAGEGTPDQVPIFAQICELLPREMKTSAREIFHDAKLLNIGTFNICDRYDIDVPTVDLDTYNIEAEAIGDQTPTENIKAAVAAVHKYGTY